MSTTGSGTGTQAAAPTATTAQDLVDAARIDLADEAAAEFDDATLLAFLNDAIREYSQQLPRTSTTIITTSSERHYSLEWDAIAVLHVEYPTGEEPPNYLPRIPYKRARDSRSYDFLPRRDLTQYPSIILAFTPEPDEEITVLYSHAHDHALTLTDNLTVPRDHHHVLTSYIMFACARLQQAQEQASPTSNSSLLMAQLVTNARRLEIAYLNALNRILSATAAESAVVVWPLDHYDRLY